MKLTLKQLNARRAAYLTAQAAYYAAQTAVREDPTPTAERLTGLDDDSKLNPEYRAKLDAMHKAQQAHEAAREAYTYEMERDHAERNVRHHYVITETAWKPSRTYGGGTYTLTVWKVEAVGKLRRVGQATACTRAHKGRDHEAWSQVILADLPPTLARRVRKAGRVDYIPSGLTADFGVKIEEIN